MFFLVNVPNLNSELKDSVKSLDALNLILLLFFDIWNVLVRERYCVNDFYYGIRMLRVYIATVKELIGGGGIINIGSKPESKIWYMESVWKNIFLGKQNEQMKMAKLPSF